MKRTILTTAAICAVLMLGVPAMATDYTWTGANNANWQDPNNWVDPVPQINGYPDSCEDTATIPNVSPQPNPIVSTTESVNWVVVNPSATLTVISGAKLTICLYLDADGDVYLNSSANNGVATLELAGNGQTSDVAAGCDIEINSVDDDDYSLLLISQDHTIQGSGTIVGNLNYSKIRIDDGMTLTSQVTIHGALAIDNVSSTGTFNNEKLVHANLANGTIDVTTATISDSVSSSSSDPRWKVSGYSTTTLRFSDSAAGSKKLVGNFDLDEGTLDIRQDVTTSGTLDAEAGVTIDVYQGKTFQAS